MFPDSSNIAVLDFSKSVDYKSNNITSFIQVPGYVLRTRWATLWAYAGEILLFGGKNELYQELLTDGLFSNKFRPTLDGIVWAYNVSSVDGQWVKALPSSDSYIQPVEQEQSAFASKKGPGYIFGGDYDKGAHKLANTTTIQSNSTIEMFPT